MRNLPTDAGASTRSMIKKRKENKMETIWEPAKYHNKWAVFDRVSRLFFYVGKGKKFCTEKARELNKEWWELHKDWRASCTS